MNVQPNIRFFSTCRDSVKGASTGNYASFNLALHTGDLPEYVEHNRHLLSTHYDLPSIPKWLNQSHSTICLTDADNHNNGDAIITQEQNKVLLIFTADCLPIFAFDSNATTTGIAHVGWRGLYNGVIENFIHTFNSHNISPHNLNIYFGTALSQQYFEVDTKFYQQFITKNTQWKQCFTPSISNTSKYQFDIYLAAKMILTKLGVLTDNIYMPTHSKESVCTYASKHHFSYRRDGTKSGRQAHIIYLQ